MTGEQTRPNDITTKASVLELTSVLLGTAEGVPPAERSRRLLKLVADSVNSDYDPVRRVGRGEAADVYRKLRMGETQTTKAAHQLLVAGIKLVSIWLRIFLLEETGVLAADPTATTEAIRRMYDTDRLGSVRSVFGSVAVRVWKQAEQEAALLLLDDRARDFMERCLENTLRSGANAEEQ